MAADKARIQAKLHTLLERAPTAEEVDAAHAAAAAGIDWGKLLPLIIQIIQGLLKPKPGP